MKILNERNLRNFPRFFCAFFSVFTSGAVVLPTGADRGLRSVVGRTPLFFSGRFVGNRLPHERQKMDWSSVSSLPQAGQNFDIISLRTVWGIRCYESIALIVESGNKIPEWNPCGEFLKTKKLFPDIFFAISPAYGAEYPFFRGIVVPGREWCTTVWCSLFYNVTGTKLDTKPA